MPYQTLAFGNIKGSFADEEKLQFNDDVLRELDDAFVTPLAT